MTRGPLVVVGDALLDVDLEGSATRLSPEAPVPVVDTERVWQRPGGAALAALLAARHADDVVLVSGIADDEGGRILRRLLSDAGVTVAGLPTRGSTVTKTRVRARGQSVLRIDRGDATVLRDRLPADVSDALMDARAICVADYGRGVTSIPALRAALESAAGRVPVVWDPHPRGCTPVAGCALVTPNEDEARQLFGDASPDAMRQKWRAGALCVTVGRRGARVFERDQPRRHVEVPHVVGTAPADACGAGDRFAVAAAAALADGADAHAAVTAAVDAAARFVVAGGAAAVSTLAPEDTGSSAAAGATGAMPEADVVAWVRAQQASGRTVVATGGCFDLLHTGHVSLLRHARQLGDALVVLVNSDDSVRGLKGPDRPVMAEADRARVLAALACVDAVTVFDDATPNRVLDLLRPDVWVKGGDYAADDLPEAEVVRRHGGDVVIVPTVSGYSSSRLIAMARNDERSSS